MAEPITGTEPLTLQLGEHRLIDGQGYSPAEIRAMAWDLGVGCVRHIGLESSARAIASMDRPLEERIPDVLDTAEADRVGAPIHLRLRIASGKHSGAYLEFNYNPGNREAPYVFRVEGFD